MNGTIKTRIGELRVIMQQKGLDAYLINGTDPHLSEYSPAHWQTREFISGFTGSAGLVIIGLNKAALWTDSRYFLQAEKELEGTGIELIKMRVPGHPEPADWLRLNLKKGARVGTDEWCMSASQFRKLKEALNRSGILFTESGDLLNNIWNDRPSLPGAPVYQHELNFAGTDRQTKINTICNELKKVGANMQIINSLDNLAWTFNLRGSDVECNPVFLAYGCISQEETILFIEDGKLSGELRDQLISEGIQVYNYKGITNYLLELAHHVRILIDPDRTNQAITNYIPNESTLIEGLSVPSQLKARKTETEITNIRQAMRKDGVALLNFLFWLDNNLGKIPVTEFTVSEKLTEFRSKQAEFKGISFYPIVGYKEHGAIVHFRATEENALTIEKDGFLLFDSGGQYSDGTTDITRTVALSELTQQQKTDFTLVLKGMIALTRAKFPANTKGYHLDILARNDLWKHGLNYGHGTGHGVGYFLNVHEGPMSIRQEINEHAIEAGMVLSNEPALYRTGEYGIRTENMIVCVADQTTEFGDFLGFETLTLFPIDTKAINRSLMNPDEIEWLNAYHQRVYDELSPLLTPELNSFLQELTKPI